MPSSFTQELKEEVLRRGVVKWEGEWEVQSMVLDWQSTQTADFVSAHQYLEGYSPREVFARDVNRVPA